MSCNRCVHEAAATLEAHGIPADQAMAAWADYSVGMTWEYLPRCPRCKKWVSPRTGVCRYAKCGAKGTQVVPASGWPPAKVILARTKYERDVIRASTPIVPPPLSAGDVVAEAEELLRVAQDGLDTVADVEQMLSETGATGAPDADTDMISEIVESFADDPDMAKLAKPRNERDYVITDDDHIGEGGPKAKFKKNVEAIRLLKTLEAEERDATDEEKRILVQYVGWGGLAKVFDRENEWYNPSSTWARNKPEWYDEHQELQELLTEDEWEAAKGSTPNAHYTSPEVVRAMWDGLKHLGFEEGTVLEPAAGVGHFFGCAPADLTANTSRVGVELDSLTARIAQKLYPDSSIQNCGFQEAKLPDEFFDVAISNVPFGNYAIYDPAFKGRKHLSRSIHNYFFAKSLDKVKPGGVVAFITSHHTLDSEDKRVREYLASQADLVGAVRLPNTAFKGNAMTEVTTDVIFLRKRAPHEGDEPGDTSWVNTEQVAMPGKDPRKKEKHAVNRYFVDHPEQMLGTLAATGTMYGPGEVTLVNDGRDMPAAMRDAMQRLPQGVMARPKTRCPVCRAFMAAGGPCNNPMCPSKHASFEPVAVPGVRDGSFVVAGGQVRQKSGSRLVDVEVKPTEVARMEGMIAVRDAARELLNLNVAGAGDEELLAAQAKLNAAYDAFVAGYGPVTAKANARLFADDPDFPFMLALENDYDPDTNTAQKAHIFSKRTVNVQKRIEHADNARDALFISLNESGVVDFDRMAALTGLTEEQLQRQLAGQVFRTPDGSWETRDEYLSGNVREKLHDAEAAAEIDPRFKANAEALRAVQPQDLEPAEINAALGSGWIPKEDVAAFAAAIFGQDLNVDYVEALAKWNIEPGHRWFNRNSTALTSTWGTRRMDGMDLLDDALNGRIPTVYDTHTEGDREVREVNQAETLAAREMQDKIKTRFKEWIWEDSDRAQRLAAKYNETFNAIVPRKYDGGHLTLPGMGTGMPPLRAHQKNAIWRVVQSKGNTLLGHIVGAGKAQPLDAKILTPMGWKRMGDMAVGDEVMACDGTATQVVGVFPQGEKDIYRVVFSDGASTECCDEHLWYVTGADADADSDGRVMQLSDIRPQLASVRFYVPQIRAHALAAYPALLSLYSESGWADRQSESRYIVAAQPVGRKQAQCIKVEHPDQLYVTDDFIVTHNTFTMIGAGMEQRRLGLRKKVMHCIPNHMLEQYGADFSRMYPGAKVLLVSAKDLGTADKRKTTMGRIATNDWDAVVVTHDALGKLPVKDETFNSFMQQEIDQLEDYLTEAKAEQAAASSGYSRSKKKDSRTVKEIEKAKKRLEAKLRARADRGAKDDGLTWEELGVDQLFVDESQKYKNLYFPTKRTRVAGIPQSESNRAFDMFIKTQFLTRRCVCGQFMGADGICHNCRAKTKTANGGVCFSTGTPISNSIAEMYTVQRYLQWDRLKAMGLGHFDAWAAQFGDTVTALEMKPTGEGYREFTRFAKFNNVPELLRIFGQVADLEQDADKLGLKRPEIDGGKAIGVEAPSSPELKDFIQECSDRADRLGDVPPEEDNMLKIIGDANKAALDMRLVNPDLPDDPNSKVNKAVGNILQVWKDSAGVTVPGVDGPQNMAQMVFLDTSTPGPGFNVYDDMKKKLVAGGIPDDQIAFIHDAKNDQEKQELFDKVNAGQVRVLFGSSEKMGSGTNAQRRLVALHHVDAPWRPSDIEQREGRIRRQGNMNPGVKLFRYVTQESFDVYRWQVLESKAKFITQVMKGDMDTRSVEDLDSVTIGYAEMKALATGNPVIIDRIKTDSELRKYAALRRAHTNKLFGLQRDVAMARDMIPVIERNVAVADAAVAQVAGFPKTFSIKIGGRTYGEKEREDAGKAFMGACQGVAGTHSGEVIGEFHGCPIRVEGNGAGKSVSVTFKVGDYTAKLDPSDSATGNMTRFVNALGAPAAEAQAGRRRIENYRTEIEQKTAEQAKPFEHIETVAALEKRLAELDAQIAAIAKNAPKQAASADAEE